MKDSAELFDTSQCFALVAQDGTDGHAALADRLAREEAARALAERQMPLFEATPTNAQP